MFIYINPVYTDFHYNLPTQKTEVFNIFSGLAQRYQCVMPSVESRTQIEVSQWDKKTRPHSPRLVLSWNVAEMSTGLYQKLTQIFGESVLDNARVISREDYRKTRTAPAKFVHLDGAHTKKIRGFPLYNCDEDIRDAFGLGEAKSILWVSRQFLNLHDAREKMRMRGDAYWFYDKGRFIIELRVNSCKEIEFIDTALRVGAVLNGNYEGFNRYEALSLAQKYLVRRNKERVMPGEVVGLEELIEDVKFRQFFATIYPEKAKALGIKDESVILVGVPGTGKTSVASSILWDPVLERISFIPLNVTELLEASYYSGKDLNDFFNGIRDLNRRYNIKPMLWCDDLESAFLEDPGASSREKAVAQSTLLNNLQGVSKDLGIRISGSTNHPERIDPRFLEFGRISYMFHLPIPKDPEILAKILITHVEKRKQELAEDVVLDEVAAHSIGYTPRMLVNLVNEAGVQAARRIFHSFSHVAEDVPQGISVTAEDYRKADSFLRTRSDLNLLERRDDEIRTFVEKQNRRTIGYYSKSH